MSAIGPKRTSPTALPAFEPKRVSRERSHNCCKAAHYGRWIKAVAQSYLRGADMSLKAILAAKGNEVVSISSTADLAAASKLLKKRQIGVLIVLGEDERLVGILSERDIVRSMAEGGDAVRQMPVSQVMTPKVVTCDVNDPISSVMERMTQGKFRHIPIFDKGRLAGIVSNRDLLKWHLETIREHMRQLETSFAELDLMRL